MRARAAGVRAVGDVMLRALQRDLPEDGVLVGVPPDYVVADERSRKAPLPDGSVLILTMAALQPDLGDFTGLFRRLQGCFPACSLVVAVPPGGDRPFRQLLSCVPGWQGVPIMDDTDEGRSSAALRVVLSSSDHLIP